MLFWGDHGKDWSGQNTTIEMTVVVTLRYLTEKAIQQPFVQSLLITKGIGAEQGCPIWKREEDSEIMNAIWEKGSASD